MKNTQKKERGFRWSPFPTELFVIVVLLGLFAAYGVPTFIGLGGMELKEPAEIAQK